MKTVNFGRVEDVKDTQKMKDSLTKLFSETKQRLIYA
jgi:hypothetical protein